MHEFVGPPAPPTHDFVGPPAPPAPDAGLPDWLLIPTGLAEGRGPRYLIPVDSSHVNAYGWADGVLVVQFKDKRGAVTATCLYTQEIPLAMWQDFQMAPSKGVWKNQNLQNIPYIKI